MEFTDYLNFEFKPNLIFPPVERKAFPFPPNLIPEALYSIYLFIEKVEGVYYLRNLKHKAFCGPLKFNKVSFDQYLFDENNNPIVDDATGEQRTKEVDIKYLTTFFENTARSVSFNFNGVSEYFLPLFQTDKKLMELPEHLQSIYSSTIYQSEHYLQWDNSQTTDHIHRKYLKDNGLKPVGKWEEGLFVNSFNSNPNLLSDDEFEMIFGVSR